MLSISATDEWRNAHPGAIIGLLELSDVENIGSSIKLDERKREIEAHLRERYKGNTRQDFLAVPVMSNYERYYKKFDKTYHVLLQLESIVLKGKSLPNVSPLVDANFMAEVETLALTAGHDVSKLREPIFIDVARKGEQFIQMNGAAKTILPGDMVMKDANGISCTIICGQDNRSPISSETKHVLYVTYAPVGVSAEAVDAQLQKIDENIRLFSPAANVVRHQLLSA